ncbi:hypothetical protein BTVI_83958 [Pitangus sulphuratus]|nr:hypothetical protein BTVI_83958 [Pitangus sulphuratus]
MVKAKLRGDRSTMYNTFIGRHKEDAFRLPSEVHSDRKAMSILECMKNGMKNYIGNVIMSHSEIMDTIVSGIGYTILITSIEIPQSLKESRKEKVEV